MSTILPNTTYPMFPFPDAAARRQCSSHVTPTVRHDTNRAESRSEKDFLMATQFPTNVVGVAPTRADDSGSQPGRRSIRTVSRVRCRWRQCRGGGRGERGAPGFRR